MGVGKKLAEELAAIIEHGKKAGLSEGDIGKLTDAHIAKQAASVAGGTGGSGWIGSLINSLGIAKWPLIASLGGIEATNLGAEAWKRVQEAKVSAEVAR